MDQCEDGEFVQGPRMERVCRLCKKPVEGRADKVYCSRACLRKSIDRRRDAKRRAQRYVRINEAEFEQLWVTQDGCCSICGVEMNLDKDSGPRAERAHLDHDHYYKKTRGILCQNCNVGLGLFGDNMARLQAAAAYLSRWGDQFMLEEADESAREQS